MKSNDHRPIWPYLGMLACLFVLCLTAPRSWQSHAPDAGPDTGSVCVLFAAPATSPAHVAPVAMPAAAPPQLPLAEVAPNEHSAPAAAPADVADRPALEGPRLFAEATPRPTVRVSDASDRLAMRPTRRELPEMRLPVERTPVAAEDATVSAEPPGWIMPQSLLEQLDALAAKLPTAAWAEAAAREVRDLVAAPPEAAEAKSRLAALRHSVDAAAMLAAQPALISLRSELLRASYALERRLDVWRLASSLQSTSGSPALVRQRGVQLRQPLAEVAALTSGSEAGLAWRQYLLLDALQSKLESGAHTSQQEKQAVAQLVLDRIETARRSSEHQTYVAQRPIAELDEALRQWSAEPVAATELIAHVEAYEATGAASAAQQLAEDYQSLLWSPSAEHRELARQVQRHYRNANLRISVSAELINRGLPQQSAVRSRIREQILGADVFGNSNTTTRLRIHLLPGAGRLRLSLRAGGLVYSNTQSSSGPAVLHSRGRTQYLAEKIIEVSPAGLSLAPARADARANSDLLGFDTDYDGLPIISSVVRSAVASQHNDAHHAALREMERRVARAARERMDREADYKIVAAAERFEQRVWTRLKRLLLEPRPLELTTTDERLLMRLRLAGKHQLGAHTPRPLALSNSLASLQLHESALNNAIDQIQLDGQTLTLPELYTHLGRRLEIDLPIPDDLPRDTTITFAAQDAVQIACKDGHIRITLAIAEIAQPRRQYRDFKVRAFYQPKVEQMSAELVRAKTIQLDGDDLGFGGQLVLRGVFSKIFSKNRTLPLIAPEVQQDPRLAGLEINQFLIEAGWIGLSIAEPLPPGHQGLAHSSL